MIPLRDNIPSRSVPLANYTFIAISAVAFLFQLSDAGERGKMVERFGMIPARITQPDQPTIVTDRKIIQTNRGPMVQEQKRPAAQPPMHPWWTVLTCIFLHGGWLHFLGNMWFLYIFGDNVEDRLGRLGFVAFYLFCGVAASLVHLLSAPGSSVPTIGASGAIAGVMGAYFLLYPHAQVLALVPIFFFIQIMVIPAPVFLGIWFLIQFFQGTFAITATQSAGVAWWAHVGGFVAGLALIWQLRRLNWLKPAVQPVSPYANTPSAFRNRRNRPYDPFNEPP